MIEHMFNKYKVLSLVPSTWREKIKKKKSQKSLQITKVKAVCDKSPLSLPVHVPRGLPWDRRGREQGPAGIQHGFPIVRGLGRASREDESIPDQAGPAKKPFTLQLYLLWKSKRESQASN